MLVYPFSNDFLIILMLTRKAVVVVVVFCSESIIVLPIFLFASSLQYHRKIWFSLETEPEKQTPCPAIFHVRPDLQQWRTRSQPSCHEILVSLESLWEEFPVGNRGQVPARSLVLSRIFPLIFWTICSGEFPPLHWALLSGEEWMLSLKLDYSMFNLNFVVLAAFGY